jgi:hypothetical protein
MCFLRFLRQLQRSDLLSMHFMKLLLLLLLLLLQTR